MNQYLEIILKEMCNRVNADYDKIDFKSENWYIQYSWTEIEEDDFIDWLSKFLKKNKKACKALMSSRSYTKKIIKQAAEEFIWNYGWKIKEI